MKRLLLVVLIGVLLATLVLGLQITAVSEKNGKDVDSLIKNLQDNDSSIRQNAADALGKLNDTRAIDPLIQALKDNDFLVRLNAANALGNIGKPAVEPLIRALKDNDFLVRYNAAWALGKINDARAVEPLILALKDDNSTVRSNAAFALGNLNDTDALNPLIQALDDEDAHVRAGAAWSLGNAKDKRAVDPLIFALKDNSSEVRLRSAEALGKMNDKRATNPLICALNDTDHDVRSEAMKSLVDWIKVFGGPEDDRINAGLETDDGGFILAGFTRSYGAGDGDVWLVHADRNGTEMWNKTFGGSGRDEGMDILETDDGGFVMVGETESFGSVDRDLWLVKVDSVGNEEWNRTFGGSGEDLGTSLKRAGDGGYVIAGITSSYGSGNRDLWLMKTDSKGEELWNRTFGGTGRNEGFSVLVAGDSYFIAGYTDSAGSRPSSLWLIKTDLSGKELWNRTFGQYGSSEGVAYSSDLTEDGGCIISGGWGPDPWIIKTDSSGIEGWNRTLELYQERDRSPGLSVKQTKDGGYLLGGYTGFDIEYFNLGRFFDSRAFLAKADPNGSWIWSTIIDVDALGEHKSSRIDLVDATMDGGIILMGGSEEIGPSIYSDSYKSSSKGDKFKPEYSGWDAWLIKLKSGNYSLRALKDQ